MDNALKAISYASWTNTDPSDAQKELGRLYLQTKSLVDAERTLRKVTLDRPEDAEAFILYARTLRNSGNAAQFEKTVLDALKRFPNEAALYILVSEYYKSKGNIPASIDVIDKAIKTMPDNTQLLLVKAKIVSSVKEKTTLLADYFAKGGKEAEAYGLAIRSAMAPESRYLAFFVSNGGLRYANLMEEVYPVVSKSKDLKRIMDESLASFSGKRITDSDNDGKYEEEYSIDKGRIVEFKKDSNQNGEPEIDMIFDNGFPVKAGYLDAANRKASCVYSAYPAVKSVSYTENDFERRYNVVPFTLSVQLVKNIPKDGLKPDKPVFRLLALDAKIPVESIARNSAYSIDEIENGSSPKSKTMDLGAGKTVAAKIDEDNDGAIDHTVNYVNGLPVSGRRDTNADGIFDTDEVYSSGLLARVQSDNNGDGRPDFIQLLAANGLPYRLEWDYTYDGRMDVVEIIGGDSSVTFQYSTRYDGVFDLSMTFTNDVLVKIVRNGGSVDIIKGSRPNLYWIGKKGPDSAIKSEIPQGRVSIGGKNYFVVTYKHKIYIEEI